MIADPDLDRRVRERLEAVAVRDAAWVATRSRRHLTHPDRQRLASIRRWSTDAHLIARIDDLLDREARS